MTYQSSYNIDAVAMSQNTEILRLEAQVELFWENEMALYRSYGLKDGMSIVECGCGSGIVGRKILKELPQSKITAFDVEPILVETAKNKAKLSGTGNYDVIQAQINSTGLEDNKYDFAITRLVLEHLSTPEEAVKEVLRILKPNGVAVFIDNDFEYHLRTCPDIPELKDLYDAYCRARNDEGGTPKIGRQLPTLLSSCGFSNIDLKIISAHSFIVGDSIFLKSEGSGIPAKLVADGYLSGESYAKIAEKWRALLKTEGHSIFRQLFCCVGKKELKNAFDNIKIKPIFYKKEIKKDENNFYGYETQKNCGGESVEKIITRVWCKVLEREDVGVDENFFEAGGNSLCALEIVELLKKELDKKISIVELFENPTIILLSRLFKDESQKFVPLNAKQRKEARVKKIKERRENVKKMRQEQLGNL